MTAHGLHVRDETVEAVAIVGHVLAGMIAVLLDEIRHLALFGAIDALDQRDAELAVVDAPDLHAAARIVGPRVVDALDQRAALDFDVEPGPFLDAALLDGVSDVIDFLQMRHDGLRVRHIR